RDETCNRVLADRKSLPGIAQGPDLLAIPDTYCDVACAACAPVEGQCSRGRIRVRVDTAVAVLPVEIVHRSAEEECEVFGLLGELFAIPAPRMTKVVAPGRIRGVLFGDRPVRGILHLGRDSRAGRCVRGVAVPAGRRRPVVGNGANAISEANLVPGGVSVDVRTTLPLADQREAGTTREDRK